MTQRVLFCFHPERDLARVNAIREVCSLPASRQAGFFEPAEYRRLLGEDKQAIRKRIREEVAGTSVTLVLIGSDTASRPIVQVQLEESLHNRNGFVGIHIHAVDDHAGEFSDPGPPPLLPPEIPFPCYVWDWDFDRLQGAIDAAEHRAERLRASLGPIPGREAGRP